MAKEEVKEGQPTPSNPPKETFGNEGWEDTDRLDKDEPGKVSDDTLKAQKPLRNKENGEEK